MNHSFRLTLMSYRKGFSAVRESLFRTPEEAFQVHDKGSSAAWNAAAMMPETVKACGGRAMTGTFRRVLRNIVRGMPHS